MQGVCLFISDYFRVFAPISACTAKIKANLFTAKFVIFFVFMCVGLVSSELPSASRIANLH